MGVQANELRIGNKVYFNLMQEVRIITISYHEIRFAAIHKTNTYDPIPITPAILEKAGFVKYKTYGVDCEYKKREMFISTNGQRFWFEWPRRSETLPGTTATEFKYVHEIQNLYHALTGKELEINL